MTMSIKRFAKQLTALLVCFSVLPACNKWLEVEPTGVILSDEALNTPEDLQRLLNSCYDVLGNAFDGRVQNICELLSDNLAAPKSIPAERSVVWQIFSWTLSLEGGAYAEVIAPLLRRCEVGNVGRQVAVLRIFKVAHQFGIQSREIGYRKQVGYISRNTQRV